MDEKLKLNQKELAYLDLLKLKEKKKEISNSIVICDELILKYKGKIQDELKSIKVLKKVSFLKKIKNRVEIKNSIENSELQIENDRQMIDSYEIELKDLKNKESEISLRIEEILKKYPDLETDKSVVIDCELKQDIKLINNIPFFDDKPLNGKYIDEEFDESLSINDLIMVHATDYFPTTFKKIKTSHEAGVKKTQNGIEYPFVSKRNTIHTALNGKVRSHDRGNWDDCPLIFIDPLKYHIDKVISCGGQDTYTSGGLDLSDESILLVRLDYYNAMEDKTLLEGYNVVLFEGIGINAVDKLLVLLGYKPQINHKYSWESKHNSNMLENFINQYNTNNNTNIRIGGRHSGSREKKYENTAIDRNIELYKYRKSQNNLNEDYTKLSVEEFTYLVDSLIDIYIGSNKHVDFKKFIIDYGISYDFETNAIIILDDDVAVKRENIKSEEVNVLFDIYISHKLEEGVNLPFEIDDNVLEELKKKEEDKKYRGLISKLWNLKYGEFLELLETENVKSVVESEINKQTPKKKTGLYGDGSIDFGTENLRILFSIVDVTLLNNIPEIKDDGEFYVNVEINPNETLGEIVDKIIDKKNKIYKLLDDEIMRREGQSEQTSIKSK